MSADLTWCKLKFSQEVVDGVKLNVVSEFVNKSIDEIEQSIAKPRIKLKLAKAVWDVERSLALVTSLNKLPEGTGFSEGPRRYLYPEEALFLLESSNLEIDHENVPMSIEEAYQILLPTAHDLDVYRVYAYLSRAGYFVRRRRGADIETLSKKSRRDEADEGEEGSDKRQKVEKGELVEICQQEVAQHWTKTDLQPLSLSLLHNFDASEERLRTANLVREKAVSWKHFKEMMDVAKHQKSSASLTQIATCNCRNSTEINHLESSGLWQGNTKPLYHPKDLLNQAEIYELIKINGPKSSCQLLKSNVEIDLDVFCSKSIQKAPDIFIKVLHSNSNLSKLMVELLNWNLTNTCIAVVDNGDLNFYNFSHYNLNNEFPSQWEKVM